MWRNLVPLILLLVAVGCSSVSAERPASLRGQLVLEVEPNPIPVTRVGDDLYEFRFAIIMREEGGVDVRIEDFTVEAIAFRTAVVRSAKFGAEEITRRGYPASVAAGQFMEYDFVRRWRIPARLLLSGASARVTVRTIDANGRRDETEVRVGVQPPPAAGSGM